MRNYFCKLILSPLIAGSLFAEDIDSLKSNALSGDLKAKIELAKHYESQNNTQEALFWYKSAALHNIAQNTTERAQEEVEVVQKYVNPLEDEESQESLEQILRGTFGLKTYGKNFFLPYTHMAKDIDDGRSKSESIFQISLQYPFGKDVLGLDEEYSIAYTQKSWWQTYSDSRPFRETNYLPEIFMMAPVAKPYVNALKIGMIHESNGKDDPISRSWNRVYAKTYHQIGNLFVSPRVWYKLPEKDKADPLDKDGDDNPDIDEYMGYGDLELIYLSGKHTFGATIRNNLAQENRGALIADWSFPFTLRNKNLYGYVYYFSGYGESLIDYDKSIDKVGIGILLSR